MHAWRYFDCSGSDNRLEWSNCWFWCIIIFTKNHKVKRNRRMYSLTNSSSYSGRRLRDCHTRGQRSLSHASRLPLGWAVVFVRVCILRIQKVRCTFYAMWLAIKQKQIKSYDHFSRAVHNLLYPICKRYSSIVPKKWRIAYLQSIKWSRI